MAKFSDMSSAQASLEERCERILTTLVNEVLVDGEPPTGDDDASLLLALTTRLLAQAMAVMGDGGSKAAEDAMHELFPSRCAAASVTPTVMEPSEAPMRTTPSAASALFVSWADAGAPRHEERLFSSWAEPSWASEDRRARSRRRTEETWTMTSWLASLGLHDAVAATIRGSASVEEASDMELAYVRSLASSGSRAQVERLLRDGDLVRHVGDEVWRGAQELQRAAAATATELHSKFCQEARAFTMSFSGLSTFFGGLEGLLGPPNPRLMAAMAREHLEAPDSRSEYTTSNYGVTTTSEIGPNCVK